MNFKRPLIILLAVTFMLMGAVSLCAAQNVDGFIGLPWGASNEAVKTSMEQRGFKLLSFTAEKAEFLGEFANEPANLTFFFLKDRFFRGEADLLNARQMGKADALKYFDDFSSMMQVKYGKTERNGAYSKNTEIYTYSWYNLPTSATPPGQASISISGGQFGKSNAVIVVYSIGEAWVKAQYLHKDI